MGMEMFPHYRNPLSFQFSILIFTASIVIFLATCQDIDLNCDADDPNCVCVDVTNSSTCFCDWGYVLDPEYQPAIGRMKFCTKFCTGGYLNCWTSTTSHTLCATGEDECVCAFGYTAILTELLHVVCEPVNCHKRYLLDDNELCNCSAFGATAEETQCECVEGYVGNKTEHPGFCKGYQCTPGANSFCFCHNGPTNPTSCECQTKATDPATKYSFLVGEEGTKERKCLPGVECPLGFALNSYGSNTTDCIPDVCIKGSPFCDTGSVYRFCEDGYTANWDLTCVPVECNNRILNTDVSYCTCADGVQDNGRVLESKCRCFTGYVSDFEKPGQCRKLCDVDMEYCLSDADKKQCTETNNQNCECDQNGYQTALLDTNQAGEVVNLDTDGRIIRKGYQGYNSRVSGYKVGCVPMCNPTFDEHCIKDEETERLKCEPGFVANREQVCEAFECNAGFSPEIYHCDCDQDAYGSVTEIQGFINDVDSEFPLTCYCLAGFVSSFVDEERFCMEQVCDPYNDEHCKANAKLDGTYLLDSARCEQTYFAVRDLSYDTDPEDELDKWKGDHPPVCVHVTNVTSCDPAVDEGCDANGECKYSLGYTPVNGKCYRLTCDLAIVQDQYPEGTWYQTANQICTKQFSVDFNNDDLYFCTPGFYPNGTGGCNIECNEYFPGCTKYVDENYFQCMFGFAPNLFVTSEGFQGDHTCIVNECNSVKEHCVCPSWYGQTKIKIEKDCECEMGYAPDGIGGCQKICYREGYQLGDVMGTKHCNSKCIGPVCVCDPGYSLTYNWINEEFICQEITCHQGNENCDCGEDPNDPEAIKYVEEVECQCVNGTKPLSDGTCTIPVMDQCVTCSSDDELNACVSEVEINGIRGITTKDCDKHTGYFGCWVEEFSRKNGSYFFSRGCGYYCTDSYMNNTYCFINQKGTPEEERICRSCCKYEENCNIMEIKSFSTHLMVHFPAVIFVLGVSLLITKTFLAPLDF